MSEAKSSTVKKAESQIKKMPVMITRGSFIFPGFEKVLEVGRPLSVSAVRVGIRDFQHKIVLVSQMNPDQDEPTAKDLFPVGVLASFKIRKEWNDGTLTLIFKAEERVRLDDLEIIKQDTEAPYWVTNPVVLHSRKLSSKEIAVSFQEHLDYAKNVHIKIPSGLLDNITKNNFNDISDALAHFATFLSTESKQRLLEELDPEARLKFFFQSVVDEEDNSQIDQKITQKIKNKVNEQQREYYLREKLKAIKEELGELEGADASEMKGYTERLNNEPFPKEIKERILKEINRYETLPAVASESNVIRNYIEWMMALPWHETKEEIRDLKFATKTLDSHHYGLEKIKRRIIEYLAVKILNKNSAKSQIICLVGPPGVGKTSLAKSIAEATGRTFVKMSLGGIKDEAEIRGHRKTYIGAMPGRVLQTMKRAKVKNPLFLFDEIDKMASSYQGDPASAMLEVLDPEQNAHFLDHYIEEEYSLQDVMFIATANYYENIPEALVDRMEIIQLSSYTEIEKYEIAVRYLIPQILKDVGLTKKHIRFRKSGIEEIIKYYTREAGVRELERLLTSVVRKFIVKLLTKELTTLVVDNKVVNEFLKKRIFDHTKKEKKSQIGVVTGLAYTQYGGDILPIEANYFPGKGNLVLTGKLGEIMKESASIALDYVKANTKHFGIDSALFENNDIHIHVPEGAVPKDGPSAGITMTTAIISALSKKPVSKEIGMTGEITLRGHILPIGGLKEKSISAHRSNLKMILIPDKNEKDLDDIPAEVLKNLEIKFFSRYEEVFKEVFHS